jgi:8-oxo-dGTP pyrophosphatase MutT (NUDIX family)
LSPLRPDIVDVWVFRDRSDDVAPRGASPTDSAAPSSNLEILLMRRAPGDILPGLWQCVSGGVEPGETATAAALRELGEETGFGPDRIAGFYHLDQVNQFHEPSFGGIATVVVFAARVSPGAEPLLSGEHDAMRWVSPAEALDLAVWPAYRESIRRIVDNLTDPGRAAWFELTLAGDRARK